MKLKGIALITLIISALLSTSIHYSVNAQESYSILHVIPSSYVSYGNSTVFIGEYGRLVVFTIGDLGGFAGITTLPPIGLAGFNGTLGSLSDFGFTFRYSVTEPSVYLVVDAIAPNGTEYLLRGNATALPTENSLLLASSSSVEWCIGLWDGFNPENISPIRCGLSFSEAASMLPQETQVAFIGLYYSGSSKSQAVIEANIVVNGVEEYFTIASAYSEAADGDIILIHSGNYSYWELLSVEYEEPAFYGYYIPHSYITIIGENRNSTVLINPKILLELINQSVIGNLTVVISKAPNYIQPALQLSNSNNVNITNIVFNILAPQKLQENYSAQQALYISYSANVTLENIYIEVSVANITVEKGDFSSLDIVPLEVENSDNINLNSPEVNVNLDNITVNNGTYFDLYVSGLSLRNSSRVNIDGLVINLYSKGVATVNGTLSIYSELVNLYYVNDSGVFYSTLNMELAHSLNLLTENSSAYYNAYAITASRSSDIIISNNTITVGKAENINAWITGIALSEINNTYVFNNTLLNVFTGNFTPGTTGVSIFAPRYYSASGKVEYPWYSENITVWGNIIEGFYEGLYIDACGGVEVNGSLTNVFPNMVENIEVRYNNISSNYVGISISGYNGSGFPGELHFNNIYNNVDVGLEYLTEYIPEFNMLLTPPPYNASHNWWGDLTGPLTYDNYGEGDEIRSSVNVTYSPWLNAPYPSGVPVIGSTLLLPLSAGETVSISAVEEADVEASVSVSNDANVTVSLLKYERNPAYEPPPFAGVKYVDVKLNASNINAVEEVVVKIYYGASEVQNELSLIPYWWNGTTWIECSDWGINTTDINGYGGYVWIRITKTSSPSISDLTGTPISVTSSPQPIPESPMMPIVMLIIASAMLTYILRRKRFRT